MRYEVYKCWNFELTGKLEFTNETNSLQAAMTDAAYSVADDTSGYITDANVAVWDTQDGVYLFSMCYTRESGWFKC